MCPPICLGAESWCPPCTHVTEPPMFHSLQTRGGPGGMLPGEILDFKNPRYATFGHFGRKFCNIVDAVITTFKGNFSTPPPYRQYFFAWPPFKAIFFFFGMPPPPSIPPAPALSQNSTQVNFIEALKKEREGGSCVER